MIPKPPSMVSAASLDSRDRIETLLAELIAQTTQAAEEQQSLPLPSLSSAPYVPVREVTTIRDVSAERVQRKERRERRRESALLRRILFSCTQGKFQLLESDADLPEPLPARGDLIALTDADAYERVRTEVTIAARLLGFAKEQLCDLVNAVGEACNNAMQYGREGVVSIRESTIENSGVSVTKLQVWVEDHGLALNSQTSVSSLPGRWTDRLSPSFSRMIAGCDRVCLYLGAQRTTFVLEAGPAFSAPVWISTNQRTIASASQNEESSEVLPHSEIRYRRLFEAALDGVLLLDATTGQIIDANPFISELLGYPHDDLLGKEIWEIGPFADREASRNAFEQLRTTGYIRYEDLPLETRDGERREVEVVSNVYTENQASVIQCNIRDIAERKQLERMLNAAFLRERRITDALQRPLLVEIAENAFPGLSVATCYAPALDEALVGGDFCDAFALPGGRVALAIADTSGKGLAAAARTIQIKEVLRAFAREAPFSPVDAVTSLNHFVCDTRSFDALADPQIDLNSEWFTCLILAFVDPATGEGSVVSAGCEPPLLLRGGDTETIVPFESACLPLGILREEVYFAMPVHLAHGDTILMVTDGITEARHDMDFLNLEGLAALAQKSASEPTLRARGQAILQGARSFSSGSLRDDACLLLAQITIA